MTFAEILPALIAQTSFFRRASWKAGDFISLIAGISELKEGDAPYKRFRTNPCPADLLPERCPALVQRVETVPKLRDVPWSSAYQDVVATDWEPSDWIHAPNNQGDEP